MRQSRFFMGAFLALAVFASGGAFAFERTEAPKYEQGYGYSAVDSAQFDKVATVAEAPRLRTEAELGSAVILCKRTSSKMFASAGHYQTMEVAVVIDGCRTGKALS